MQPKCPLCLQPDSPLFTQFKEKSFGAIREWTYYRCPQCSLIYLEPSQRLNPEAEKARYDVHENSELAPNYRQFLEKLWIPFKSHISPGDHGLDYGCGPHPALIEIAKEGGHKLEGYDPIYKPKGITRETYDYLVSTEVIEHCFEPNKTFDHWQSLTKPGAFIGLMTQFYQEGMDFKAWTYRRDDTHVCLYSEPTIKWIAQNWGWEIIKMDSPLVIFKKAVCG